MADTPHLPLVVDLDGTVIRTDMLWELLARYLRRNPFALVRVLLWWLRGRARLKQELGKRVAVDPASLPYHQPFLHWLRQENAAGRHLVLATASDQRMAQPVADYLGLFAEVLASDGQTNLRQEAKRLALVGKYGERGFDYAGNSRDDLVVWRSARRAIVVNASPAVQQRAAGIAEAGPTFCEGYVPCAVARCFATELFWRSGYILALVAGLLLAMAFPKWNLAGFAWIAPALLLAAAHGKSKADAFRVGCAGGLTFWLVSLYWLLLMPATGFPILGWAALAGYVAVYFGLWLVLALPAGRPAWDTWAGRTSWALGGAAAWVALEMVRARLFSGFPWSFLGVSQFQLVPLLQVASVTGVYGVSFLITWFSLALYAAGVMILRHPTRRQVWQVEIFLPMTAVVACYVAGFFALSGVPTPPSTVRVTAIQPSVPQTLIWSEADNARRFQDLLELSRRALLAGTNATDLLLWPESAVPGLDDATYLAINEFVRSNHVWLVLNGDHGEMHPAQTNYFNAAFLVSPAGEWRQVYHKRQLVIFGEYVPLVRWLPFLKWLTPISGGWSAGDRPVTFALTRQAPPPPSGVIHISSDPAAPDDRTFHCAPLICFEDTFPGAVRDSSSPDVDFLINLTNDGWFGESAEQWQHLANAVFRAVENGLPLLRCANNGVTGLISAHGRLETVFRDPHQSEYGPGALTVEIPMRPAEQKAASTFYRRHGDWFGWACVGLTVAGIIGRRRSL